MGGVAPRATGGGRGGGVISLRVEPEELGRDEVTVEGDGYRHLFRARRLAVGDAVRLADGAGRARWAEVVSVDRRSGVLRLGGEAPAPEPAARVHLLVAAPKKDRAATLVEKATELGVASVRLLETARTPRGFGSGTLRRLERVAVAAFEQCGRGLLPEITGTHPWDEVPALLDGCGAGERRWVLDLDPSAVPGAALAGAVPEGGSAVLLVGPEGGWTDGEREELARRGCRPVVLGPTVLRVETAALAGAALLLAGATAAPHSVADSSADGAPDGTSSGTTGR